MQTPEARGTACRICQSERTRCLYRQPGYDVWRCQDCGTAFVRPTEAFPNLLAAQDLNASAEGRRYMDEVFIRRESFWLHYQAERLTAIEEILGHKGRLLDIGCGMGYFLLAAKRRGWIGVGVEPSGPQASYARNTLGLDVYASRFEELNLEPASFDLVTLWGVLEHVSNPRDFLSGARRLLKPAGLLALQTPNQGSLITLLAAVGYSLSAGRYLLPVYSHEHLFRFDEKALRRLLAWTGFETLRIEQYDNLHVMLTRMSLAPHAFLRKVVLAVIHLLAAWIGRRNQLLAYARPM